MNRIPFFLLSTLALLSLSLPQGLTMVSAQPPATKHPEPPDHPIAPALKLARASRAVMAKVNDYEAMLTKRELVRGRMLVQQMQIRFREKPFSVYLKYRQPNAGREILYVHGTNNNQIFAHEGSGLSSLVGTVSLSPTSIDVMKENRHPITMIGISNLLELVIKQWEDESKYGEIDVQYYPDAKLGSVKCQVIESSHPQPRRQFKFHKTRLFLDKETSIPIRIEQYAFPTRPGQQPTIVEEYTYTNIRTNVGLKEIDFSRKNRNYKF